MSDQQQGVPQVQPDQEQIRQAQREAGQQWLAGKRQRAGK